MASHRKIFEALVELMKKDVSKLTGSQLKKIEGVQSVASSYALDSVRKSDFVEAVELISESFKRSSRECKQGYDVYNRAGSFTKTISVMEFMRTLAKAQGINFKEILKKMNDK